MRFTRFVLMCSLALAGCLGNVDPVTQRIVTGKVMTKDYRLDNPVIVAESSDHRVFVTHLMRDGSFKLELPSNVAYRLTLANTTRSGSYASVARVNWPLSTGANRWAQLGAGATLDLGHVYQRGSTQWGIQCSGCSGGGGYDADQGGDCHEDDSAKCSKSSSENDCDCDHKYKEADNCDKDDDADEHEHECNKADGDGGGDDGYGSDDHDGNDDHHDHGGTCDGGAGGSGGYGGGSAGGSSGAAAGGMCMMNVDCAIGLDCVASVCTTPSTTK